MKALLLIDIQKGLTRRKLYKKNEFFDTVNHAITKFRTDSRTIIFVQHKNKQLIPGAEAWEIDENVLKASEDIVFEKNKGDAFTNRELCDYLNSQSITDVVIGGLVTHGCVSYTCKGGVDKKLNISLLKKAHSCWNADAEEKIEATERILKAYGVSIVGVDHI